MLDKIVAFNRVLKAELENTPQVTFIDGDTPLLDKNGEVDPSMFRDGLHLNDKGYRIWTQLIREAMKKNG